MATTDVTTEKYGKAAFEMAADGRKWKDLPEDEKVLWRHNGFRTALNMKAQAMPADKARAHFKALTDEFEAKLAPLLALKAERDKKGGNLTFKQAAEYDAKIRKANEGLYEIEMERAAIARALGPRGLIEE